MKEMCRQEWVREKFLKDPDAVLSSDLLLDQMLSNKQVGLKSSSRQFISFLFLFFVLLRKPFFQITCKYEKSFSQTITTNLQNNQLQKEDKLHALIGCLYAKISLKMLIKHIFMTFQIQINITLSNKNFIYFRILIVQISTVLISIDVFSSQFCNCSLVISLQTQQILLMICYPNYVPVNCQMYLTTSSVTGPLFYVFRLSRYYI